ncbi:hydantoinase B/oxoprolinase family protein [Candidatus Poribacteria bacterium]|nr:hydantoinase B/oxoprolinase family protein [Candidatus Poribacteria bacterium]
MVDAITLEIFKNLFGSVAEEMGVVLQRTGFSPNIKERLDFSCAVFDQKADMVAQAAHIPVHLGSMPLSVQSAVQDVPMEPGDVAILNDPYRGGTHLPDVTMVAPVFLGEPRPTFYVASRAHHADVGGSTPGSMPLSTSIFQEGLRIPPLKIMAKGKPVPDVLSMFLANVRTPEEREGDISAQLAACATGGKRLAEMTARYGLDELKSHAAALQDYSETLMRQCISRIPSGRYGFQDFMDDDGVTDEKIPIVVTITVEHDSATIDFSGTAAQVKGCVNAVLAITVSCVFYVFRCLAGENIPSNSGCMRPITVSAPLGTLVNALPPAAVAGGNVETSQRIVDVLLGALAKALPRQIPAASCGSMNNVSIGGYDCIRRRPFAYYETLAGGMGARPDKDGVSAVHSHMTNTMNTPVEVIENAYPLRVLCYNIRQDSGGSGVRRGGDGLIREYELLCDSSVSILSERRRYAPYGLDGGKDGRRGENHLFRNGEWKSLPSKANLDCRKGERLRIMTPGGGGYGR